MEDFQDGKEVEINGKMYIQREVKETGFRFCVPMRSVRPEVNHQNQTDSGIIAIIDSFLFSIKENKRDVACKCFLENIVEFCIEEQSSNSFKFLDNLCRSLLTCNIEHTGIEKTRSYLEKDNKKQNVANGIQKQIHTSGYLSVETDKQYLIRKIKEDIEKSPIISNEKIALYELLADLLNSPTPQPNCSVLQGQMCNHE